jgi:hypothetical protein
MSTVCYFLDALEQWSLAFVRIPCRSLIAGDSSGELKPYVSLTYLRSSLIRPIKI